MPQTPVHPGAVDDLPAGVAIRSSRGLVKRPRRELASALPALPCACASLRRASRAVTQLYDRQLRSEGLRPTQFTLLQVLERAGALTQGRLGELLALDSTTLSRTLRPLEEKGWVRGRPGSDRRERHWELTAGGERKLAEAVPAWGRAQRELRSRFGEAGWEALVAGLTHAAEVSRDE